MMSAAEMYDRLAGSDSGFLALMLMTLIVMALVWWIFRRAGGRLPNDLFSFPMPSLQWIVVIGLLVRVPSLFRPFWYDEIFSANVAMLPHVGDLITAIMGDVHPPMFYTILWVWSHLVGHAQLLMRLVPLLFGVLCIPMAHHLVYVLSGKDHRLSRMAALVAALLPALVHYSTELRGYSLLVYLVLYALLAIADKRPQTFALVVALITTTHNIGYLYGLALVLIGVQTHGRLWLQYCIAPAAVVCVQLPLLILQSRDVADGFWLPPLTIGGFFRPIAEMTMYQSSAPGVAFLWAGAIALTALAFWNVRNDYRVRLLIKLMIPVAVGLAVASIIWRPIYLPRALLPVTVCIALLWAWASARRPMLQVGLIAFLCLGLVGLYALPYNDVETPLKACDGAPVFAGDVPSALYARFYLPDSIVGIWDEANDTNQSLPDDAKAAFGFQQRSQPGKARCVIAFDTPFSRPEERALIAGIPGEITRTEFNVFFHLIVIQVPR